MENKIFKAQVVIYKMLTEIQDKQKGEKVASLSHYEKELLKEIKKLDDENNPNKGTYAIS